LNFGLPREQPIAFLWDATQGKLYLDLNRNGDLTDDSDGKFSSDSGGPKDVLQSFKGIRLMLQTQSGRRPVVLDLDLWDYRSGNSAIYATAKLRSYWSGKFTLEGRDWQLGVIERPQTSDFSGRNGYLLLRDWGKRDEPLNVEDGSLDAFVFPANLFFRGKAYRVECVPEQQDDRSRYRVQLAEQPVGLGEVKISGEFIRRLILKGGPFTVVLDEPSGTSQVPLGTYSGYQVQLQRGGVIASLDQLSSEQGVSKRIVVKGGMTAALVGGPLTNSVTVSRRGKSLVLSYRLVGAGGETYRRLQQASSKPPRFTIFQGEKKLASGEFEFG
jgi:hypothetical protein